MPIRSDPHRLGRGSHPAVFHPALRDEPGQHRLPAFPAEFLPGLVAAVPPVGRHRASPAFGAFCARWKPIDHSGAGYAFRAFADGFSLCYLHESNASPHATFGVVYEKLVFHLVGAAGIGRSVRTPAGGSRSVQAPWWTVLTQARRFHASLGPSARRLARRLLPASFRRAIGQEVYSEATAQRLFDEAKRNLLRDPRAYWESLAEDRDA